MFRFINKNIRIFLLSDILYYGGYDLLTAFLSVLITTKIAPDRLDILGIVISYQMIIRVLTEFPLSKITNIFPLRIKKNIVAISIIIYGCGIGILGFSTEIWHVFLILTSMSIMEALAYPLKWTLFTKMQDPNKEELEWSLEDVLSTLAAAVFSTIGGFIANSFGLPLIFIIFAMLFICSGILFIFIKYKKS